VTNRYGRTKTPEHLCAFLVFMHRVIHGFSTGLDGKHLISGPVGL
jgi:hypothetical protein